MADTLGALLSVNVGDAKPMFVQGETVLTGFDKRPTDGAVRVEAGGLVPDDHVDDAADPDRALLFYQRDSYDSWERELGRTLPYGTFGENLTFEGPADEEVALGDELRVGTVRLRVTQPRIPCRKMAVRLGEEDFPNRYLRSGRLGFFCRVLEAGVVRPGDRVERVRRGGDGMSVADLARILHRERPDAGSLGRVLGCTGLPPALRRRAERMLRRARGEDGDWPGDRTLVVTARRREAAEVVSFDLADPERARLPDAEAGQFLTLSLDVPGVDSPVVRTYTVVGRSDDGAGYRIAVKREPAPAEAPDAPAGLASGHLHTAVGQGARLRARSPRGRFVLAPGERPVVLVSAGIGITPMLAMLGRLAAQDGADGEGGEDGRTGRTVHFVHGARSSRELAFGAQVRALVASRAGLHSHLLFSRPAPGDVLGEHFDEAGRLTAATLERVLPSLDADYYVCGPAGFMADIVTGLVERGVPAEQVRYEFFGAARPLFGDEAGEGAGAVVADGDGRPVTVTFARSGITVPWRENTFSLLALAEQAGLRPEASCRTGLCGTCVARIDGGRVDYAITPLDEAPPGQVTVCCARPATSVMIDL
ncbi:MOSC domain-containing protein [Streptomyces boncukensis]|uniref:MOSC domain-containing protein n=1 Tax=Streptomyces boncukensis TaxID=2711219 RepID=A0A6G4WTL7_9ACTN|nr:MOSC domain-containing protein [Streptomyces boncukensis]NGO68343.1 MOSC domain-containing protein [Streptomyces boncukensis]